MRIIGITGGVGAGKSSILDYIKNHYSARIIQADLVAHELQKPGGSCYEKIVAYFGTKVLKEDKTIDREKLSQYIFGVPENLSVINGIIHPAVREYIKKEIEKEKKSGRLSCFFIEAALLIEASYGEICDEMWYIYTEEEIRRKRLRESRSYADEKIDRIFSIQLSEAEFRSHCKYVIDNNGSLEKTYEQIDSLIGGI